MRNKDLGSMDGSQNQPASQKQVPAWIVILALALLLGFLAFLAIGVKKTGIKQLEIGKPIPDFSLTTFSKETVNTSDLRGKKVLVNFWASWCSTCEDETKALEEVWQEVEENGSIVFLGVDWSDSEPEALAFLKKYGITYPNGPDLKTKISQYFNIRGVPETYLIDEQGNLVNIRIGPFTTSDEVREFIGQPTP